MRLVDVTSFYGRSGGGIRTYLHARTRALTALGHQVHRVVPGEVSSVSRTPDGAVEHTVAGPALPFDRNYRCFGELAAVGRLLHELSPEVVEVGSHYVLPWRIRALAPRAARVVGFLHSNLPDTFVAPAVRRLPRALAAACERAAWRAVAAAHDHYDATLCASRVVEARLEAGGVPRVVRVGLGVELARFVPSEARLAGAAPRGGVCYIGRLSRDKEAGLLLAAAPRLRAAGLVLRVAGDGPSAPAFARARALEYLGPLSREGVGELLARSEVCVVPGRYETFSLAAAEALASGVPVVCAEGGAAAELARHALAGELFAPGDAEGLARAVLRACRWSAAERREAARRARRFAEGALDWSAVAQRLVAVYRGEAPAGQGAVRRAAAAARPSAAAAATAPRSLGRAELRG